jgi:hypothetical protein
MKKLYIIVNITKNGYFMPGTRGLTQDIKQSGLWSSLQGAISFLENYGEADDIYQIEKVYKKIT